MVPIPQRADSCFKSTLEFAFLSISLPNLPLCCARISQILRVPEYFSCKMVDSSKNVNGRFPVEQDIRVIFVLGGPGSGKGTQCTKIVEQFGFTHLSVGDLLRDEIKSGSDNGTMIKNMIKEGEVVPPEVAIKLLLKAMSESRNNKFLIDGFPRDEENRAAFERITKIAPEFVLFFDCPEEELKQRLLSRNQGRDDDNIETIEKRFRVFNESSLPVIKYYNAKSKVQKVNAAKPIEEVFEDVKAIFMQYNTVTNCSGNQNGRRLTGHEHVTSCTKQLLRSTRRMLTYIFSKVFLWKRACIY